MDINRTNRDLIDVLVPDQEQPIYGTVVDVDALALQALVLVRSAKNARWIAIQAADLATQLDVRIEAGQRVRVVIQHNVVVSMAATSGTRRSNLTQNTVNAAGSAPTSQTSFALIGIGGPAPTTVNKAEVYGNMKVRGQINLVPGSNMPPLVLAATAQGQTVVGLRADQLNKSVLAGDGMSGGGLLTADRTLAVDSTVLRTTGHALFIATATQLGHIKVGTSLSINPTTGVLDTVPGSTAPSAHASTHSSGGTDPITISNLAGILSGAKGGTGVDNGASLLTVPVTGVAALLGVSNAFSVYQTAPSLQVSSTVTPGVGQVRIGGTNPSIYYDRGGVAEWLIYQASSTSLNIRDLTNARMLMTITPGTTGNATIALLDKATVAGTIVATGVVSGSNINTGFVGGSGTAALLATANPFTAKQTVTLTTAQLRLAYDSTHYADFTVASTGALTIAPTTTQTLNVTGTLDVSSTLTAGNISATPTASYIPKADGSNKLALGWLPVIDATVHGSQTVGTLHAAVVAAGASGFMTGADKTKLDGIATGATANVGTVTSVALAVSGVLHSVSGSPVTTSGTLTLSLVTQTANRVFAGPASGGAVAPTFRALVADDMAALLSTPNVFTQTQFATLAAGNTNWSGLNVENTSTTGNTAAAAQINVTHGSSVAVMRAFGPSYTSDAFFTDSVQFGTPASGAGSVKIRNGALAGNITLAIGTVDRFTLTQTSISTTIPLAVTGALSATGSIVGSNILSGFVGGSGTAALLGTLNAFTQAQDFSEIAAPATPSASTVRFYAKDKAGVSSLYWKNDAGTEYDLSNIVVGGSAGTVTSVALAVSGVLHSVSGSPVTTSGTITLSLLTQSANMVFAGPASGGAVTPTFRALVAADLLPINLASSANGGVTGTLPVANGGTNITVYAVGDLLYASATGTLSKLADVATGNALIAGGIGVAPAWGKIGLTTHVSGTLAVGSGGTGLTVYVVGDLLYASGTTTVASLADAATGNVLITGGVGVAPSYGKVGLTTHISGILAVANGGTNASTAAGARSSLSTAASGWLFSAGVGITGGGTITDTAGTITHAVDQAFSPTWTGTHTFNLQPTIAANLSFSGARLITSTSTNNLTLAPGGDLLLDPTGNDILPVTGYDLNLGSVSQKFLTLHVAEIWAQTLVAQNTIATIGGRILVGPTTQLAADLSSGATSISVKHNQMVSGDRIYLESAPGGISQVEFMAVTAGATGTGPYSYTVTRNLDGSGANSWSAGDAVFNTGQTGNGFIDLYSVRGVKTSSQAGPTVAMNVRNSATFNDWSEHAALGNLNGLYDYSSDVYGVAFGKQAAHWVGVDATNGVRFMVGTTQYANWSTSGNIQVGRTTLSSVQVNTGGDVLLNTAGVTKLKLDNAGTIIVGENANSRHYVSITGTDTIFTYKDSGGVSTGLIHLYTSSLLPAITIGDIAQSNIYAYNGDIHLRQATDDYLLLTNSGTITVGKSGNPQLTLTGTDIKLKNSAGVVGFQVNSSGNLNLLGVLDIGSSGGIYQGTGTFASPTTGLKLWNDTGKGRIAGYNTAVEQWSAGTDGKLYAGAGNVVLSAMGLWASAGGIGGTALAPQLLFTGSGIETPTGELRLTNIGLFVAANGVGALSWEETPLGFVSTSMNTFAVGGTTEYDLTIRGSLANPSTRMYLSAETDGGLLSFIEIQDGDMTLTAPGSIWLNGTVTVGAGAATPALISSANSFTVDQVHIGHGIMLETTGGGAAALLALSSTTAIGVRVGTTGGWSRALSFLKSDNSTLGAYGAVGGIDTLANLWMGPSYTAPWLTVSSTDVVVTGALAAGNISATPTASYIPKADGSNKLALGWLPVIDATVHGAQTVGTLHAAVIAAGASGFMTGTDKTKLDGVATGATANVGTVTSVALSVSGVLHSVSGSPVTTSGTLTLSLVTQTANTVFAGPASGGVLAPTFRSLVAADIPVISLTAGVSGILPGTNGGTGVNNGSFLLTVPATGTAALLGTANVFTVAQAVDLGAANGPHLQIASAAGKTRQIIFYSGTPGVTANQRWNLSVNATAEGGANAGSNFILQSFDDTGVAIGTPLSIMRSSMIATFAAQVSATGVQVSSAITASAGQVRLGGTSPSLYYDRGGTTEWLIYQAGSANLQIRDAVNARMLVTITPGTTGNATIALLDKATVAGTMAATGVVSGSNINTGFIGGSGTAALIATANVFTVVQEVDTAASTVLIGKQSANNTSGAVIDLYKTRSVDFSAGVAPTSGDNLFAIRALASDGAGTFRAAGSFTFYADGTISATSLPTRAAIFVGTAGTTVVSEAARFTNAKALWVGKTSGGGTNAGDVSAGGAIVADGTISGSNIVSTFLGGAGTAALIATANAFSAKQTVTLTTAQLQLAYNGSNTVDFTANISGNLVVTPSGTGTTFTGILAATGNIIATGALIASNIPSGFSATGAGTLATGGFTLTVVATGTAALVGSAQTYTAKQTIQFNTGPQLRIAHDGVDYTDFAVAFGGVLSINPSGGTVSVVGALTATGVVSGSNINSAFVAGAGTAVVNSAQVIAGVGLTGGGAFSAGNPSLALGTPTTLTVATTNSVSGTTHSHAITSSSAPGAAASLLATTAAGALTLGGLLTLTAGLNANQLGVNVAPGGGIQAKVQANATSTVGFQVLGFSGSATADLLRVWTSASQGWTFDQLGRASHIQTTKPTVTAGTGAGTGPTITVTAGSTDVVGEITIVTGTTPAASATILTMTFSAAWGAAPKYIQFEPVNATAAAWAAWQPFWSATSTTTATLTSTATALTASTTFVYRYLVVG